MAWNEASASGPGLTDPRTGMNSRHSLVAQLRQSVFSRLAGYEDVNDADRLGRDPAMRWAVGGRAVWTEAASTSQMGRFETAVMTTATHREALCDLSGQWIDRARGRRRTLVLDMDRSVSPTYGEQQGMAYNGHFECTCYHPLFVFNQDGALERCQLRPGNVHSAAGWREVLEPVVRYTIFQMAEVAVPRALFERILARISRLRPPDPLPSGWDRAPLRTPTEGVRPRGTGGGLGEPSCGLFGDRPVGNEPATASCPAENRCPGPAGWGIRPRDRDGPGPSGKCRRRTRSAPRALLQRRTRCRLCPPRRSWRSPISWARP
jgi:hypothetical protein